jgi:hypothetical protein
MRATIISHMIDHIQVADLAVVHGSVFVVVPSSRYIVLYWQLLHSQFEVANARAGCFVVILFFIVMNSSCNLGQFVKEWLSASNSTNRCGFRSEVP